MTIYFICKEYDGVDRDRIMEHPPLFQRECDVFRMVYGTIFMYLKIENGNEWKRKKRLKVFDLFGNGG